MDKYSIYDIEEELKTIWPEWHIISIVSQSPSGGVFRIRRESFGVPFDSVLRIIRMNDESEPYGCRPAEPEGQDISEEIQGGDTAETRALMPPAHDAVSGNMQAGVYFQSGGVKPSLSKQEMNNGGIPDAFRFQVQIIEALRGVPNTVITEDYFIKREGKTCSLFLRMELLTSVLELLQGQQERHLQFPVSKVIRMGRDLCTALTFCREKGIYHWNIKPENIFMDEFDSFKLGDFGLSGRTGMGYSELAGQKNGAAYYAAPEVYDRNFYNETTDIYSLGIILYQILNKGRIPFLPMEGKFDPRELENANKRRLNGEPLPPLAGIHGTDVDGKTAAGLDAIIRKACAPLVEERFQSAKEFYDALSGLESGLMKKTLHRQDDPAWKAGKHEYPRTVKQKEKEGYPHRNGTSKQKTWLRRAFLDLAAILFLVCMTVVIKVLILNSGSSPDMDSTDHSSVEVSAETAVKIPDREDEQSDNIHTDNIQTDKIQTEDTQTGETGIIVEEQAVSEENEIIVQQERYGSITDSWEEIIEAGEDGTYIDKYYIGDTKEINLGAEGVILMELVAMDEDELAEYSGNEQFAHMTWIAKDLLNSRHYMNYGESTEGVWEGSDLRLWLRESILPLFPEEVRSNIKTVKKYSASDYDEATGLIDYALETPNEVLTEDMIWIPSYTEVFSKVFYADEEPVYNIAFSDDASRVRYRLDGTEDWWWLRSADGYSLFHIVRQEGRWDVSNVYYEGGVIIGFCL